MIRVVLISLMFVLLAAGIVERKGTLPKKLKEISGWVFVNDSTLVAHNDSGNDPVLYVLNTDGTIRHETLLEGTGNIDFEDIATDRKGNIYLADFGNNGNTRKDLAIYKLNMWNVLHDDAVTGKAIAFSYEDQEAFPPAAAQRYFDAEALAYYKDSLYIFTKCRTEPFDGKCMIYRLPVTPGTHKAVYKTYLKTGKRGWLKDSVTAADIRNGELYLLTYTKMLIYTLGKDRKGTFKTQVSMLPISQKEALAVHKNGKIYVTDERQKLIGGGTIFVVTQKPEKKK